ncbi:MAG: hypothetical protein AAF662_05910 [Pseudomonadota bacterium]
MKVLTAAIVLAATLAAVASPPSYDVEELPDVEISDPPPMAWDSIQVAGEFPSGTKFRISLALDADRMLTSFDIQVNEDTVEIPRNCWPAPAVFLNSLTTVGGTPRDGLDELWIGVAADYGPTIEDVGDYTVRVSGGEFVYANVFFEAGKLAGQYVDACGFELDAA